MDPLKDVLSKLKIRAWGLVGNDNVGVRFPYISTIDGTGATTGDMTSTKSIAGRRKEMWQIMR